MIGTADSALVRKTMVAMTDWLTKRHGFGLSANDLQSLDYVYRAFVTAGPDITYAFPNGGGRGFGRWPSYAQLMLESDGTGLNRSYLATEANFRVLKDLETRNLVVPLVGNFSGDKTLRAVGKYLKDRGYAVRIKTWNDNDSFIRRDRARIQFQIINPPKH